MRRRPEAELKGYSDIGLPACGKKGDQPAFVLDISEKTKARCGEEVCIHGDIILVSTLRKISRIKCPVPKFYTDFSPRTEPIVRADFFPLCSPSSPGSDQSSVVVIAAVVLTVVINADSAERKGIGVSTLKPKVKLWNTR